MATSKATTNLSVVSFLHFSFTLVSVIFLSYKVLHLERELTAVRDKLRSQAPPNLDKQTAVSSSGKDVRSNRKRRLNRNLQTLGLSASETLENVCLEKWIQAIQVKGTGNETGALPCIRGPPGPPGERGPHGHPGSPAPTRVNMTYIREAVRRISAQNQRETMKFFAPRFTSKLPSVISVREGDKVSINVGVTGYPVPRVTWSIPHNSHGNHSQHRYEIIDGKLEIPKVHYEDKGVHTCLAENVFGMARKTVELVVFGSPRFTSSPPEQTIGYLGKYTRLPCDVTGYPTPQIKWDRFPLAPLPQDRSTVRHNGLYITNTKTDDGGIYSCKAYNEFGSVINDILLKVEPVVPPFFSASPSASISVSSLRESIRVNCSAKGSPLPTVTWFKNGVAMPVINHITADEFTCELAIDDFQVADQASYKCVAHNEYNDTVESSSKIFKCRDPGKPQNVIVVNTGPWSGEWVRYLCHPGYTMRGPAVRRCLPSGKWSGRQPLCTEKPECIDYLTIDDYTRSVSYKTQSVKCDTELYGGAWYRFTNATMNTRCASDHYCDTSQAGWLREAHPTVGEGRVRRIVCFGEIATGCCAYKTNILVRNCGEFYVYKLTPVPFCNLRYCTN